MQSKLLEARSNASGVGWIFRCDSAMLTMLLCRTIPDDGETRPARRLLLELRVSTFVQRSPITGQEGFFEHIKRRPSTRRIHRETQEAFRRDSNKICDRFFGGLLHSFLGDDAASRCV
jgi:hypothetical protein